MIERARVSGPLSKNTLQSLRSTRENLKRAFDGLEALEVARARSKEADYFLQQIVLAVCDLLSVGNIEQAVDTVPDNDPFFAKERKLYLIDTVHKLSQYVRFGPLLLAFARKYPMFRHLMVRTVSIRPKQPLLRLNQHRVSQAGFLYQCVHRISHTENDAANIRNQLGGDLKAAASRVLRKAKNQGRIHAEIQLVIFFEREPQAVSPPRVICASKNACYLCNLFLATHGRFHTPRTHGKLYYQWLLPDLSASCLPEQSRTRMEEVYRQFQRRVEEQIRLSLVGCRVFHRFPNESRIFSVRSLSATEASAVSSSTILDPSGNGNALTNKARRDSAFAAVSSPPRDDGSDDGDKAHETEAPGPSAPAEEGVLSVRESDDLSTNQTNGDVEPQVLDASIPRSLSPSTGGSILPAASAGEVIDLAPGEETCISLLPDCVPIRFHTSRIHTEVNYHVASSICSTQSLLPPGALRLTVTWLDANEMKEETCLPQVIDLRSDWGCDEVSKLALKSDGLFLKNGREMINLRPSTGESAHSSGINEA
ncbi:hypothetical protein MPH_05231 [Macrophomina phaseolina MS6]|uniref:Uncharacterized protein n=1 Tax=Macrophomina phaseolina (strain MS6) TaxID=1126212 RepID=K2SLD9_MACPH|nr:hypothetical protein MPH_05231 [Macrophomina phaseolina MS6]